MYCPAAPPPNLEGQVQVVPEVLAGLGGDAAEPHDPPGWPVGDLDVAEGMGELPSALGIDPTALASTCIARPWVVVSPRSVPEEQNS